MLDNQDRSVLLQLVDNANFPGKLSERVTALKQKLSQEPGESLWQAACRNLLTVDDYERVKRRVESEPGEASEG